MSASLGPVRGAVRRAHFPSFDETAGGLVSPPAEPRAPEREAAAAVERQRREREAYEAGRRQGCEAAHREWDGRLRALARALEEAAEGLRAERVRLADEVDRRLPGIVFELVRKILGREPAGDADAEALVRAVGSRLTGASAGAVLRLAPATVEAFQAWCATGGLPSLAGIRVESDATLAPGEWRLDTTEGALDGRVGIQLEEAWQLLAEAGA